MAIELLSKSAYARHRRCDEKAVRKAIAEGRISLINGKIDPEVADIQWAKNTRARVSQGGAGAGSAQVDLGLDGDGSAAGSGAAAGVQAGGGAAPSAAADKPATDPSYMQFRMRREQADAEVAEMNSAKMRGTMLMRQDVDRAMFEIGREIRDRLTACARRIASEVASIPTAEGCELVVDREHRIVLELLVTSFREKIGASVKAAS